jgi:glutamate racemase
MILPVGIFDSGVGGISVLEEAMRLMPDHSFLFYADRDHVPYGKRSREEIVELTDDAVRFLIGQGATTVVLACNTATSAAAPYLRAKYDLPIIGMEPAVKVASRDLDEDKDSHILVTATDLTLRLKKLEDLIHRLGVDEAVYPLSLQGLVDFAEQRIFDGGEVEGYLRHAFLPFDFHHIHAIVLGCTHFTYYRSQIALIASGLAGHTIPVIDGNDGTVRHLKDVAPDEDLPISAPEKRVRFFESGREKPYDYFAPYLEKAHIENTLGVSS